MVLGKLHTRHIHHPMYTLRYIPGIYHPMYTHGYTPPVTHPGYTTRVHLLHTPGIPRLWRKGENVARSIPPSLGERAYFPIGRRDSQMCKTVQNGVILGVKTVIIPARK